MSDSLDVSVEVTCDQDQQPDYLEKQPMLADLELSVEVGTIAGTEVAGGLGEGVETVNDAELGLERSAGVGTDSAVAAAAEANYGPSESGSGVDSSAHDSAGATVQRVQGGDAEDGGEGEELLGAAADSHTRPSRDSSCWCWRCCGGRQGGSPRRTQRWSVGDECLIYSQSASLWCRGTVAAVVLADAETGVAAAATPSNDAAVTVQISYVKPNGAQMQKLLVADSPALKPRTQVPGGQTGSASPRAAMALHKTVAARSTPTPPPMVTPRGRRRGVSSSPPTSYRCVSI